MAILSKMLTLSKGIGVKPLLKSVEGEAPMYENLNTFRMSAAMAKHAGQMQAVVAQNVANADTPSYVARDLPSFETFYTPVETAATQRATRTKHMHGVMPGVTSAEPFEVKSQASPNGNQVSLETEMLKSVDAKRQHDRALAIYKNTLSVLRSTLRSN
jgi:flagellar basal-body rod protein FlgB